MKKYISLLVLTVCCVGLMHGKTADEQSVTFVNRTEKNILIGLKAKRPIPFMINTAKKTIYLSKHDTQTIKLSQTDTKGKPFTVKGFQAFTSPSLKKLALCVVGRVDKCKGIRFSADSKKIAPGTTYTITLEKKKLKVS